MNFRERIKSIRDRWYAEERSPISLDNKWFMDLEIIAEDLLRERDSILEGKKCLKLRPIKRKK